MFDRVSCTKDKVYNFGIQYDKELQSLRNSFQNFSSIDERKWIKDVDFDLPIKPLAFEPIIDDKSHKLLLEDKKKLVYFEKFLLK